jgi:hypothetical protein
MEEAVMAQFDLEKHALVGPGGLLTVPDEDEITRKLFMLLEGECEGLGPIQAALKFGYSKQRYFQIRAAYLERGAAALLSQKRGPKKNYRRTPEVVRQVIRHRFLDPDATPQVIAQKLIQSGWAISIRSVERVLADYELQKKTTQVPPAPGNRAGRSADQPQTGPHRRRRSAQHRTRRSPATGR